MGKKHKLFGLPGLPWKNVENSRSPRGRWLAHRKTCQLGQVPASQREVQALRGSRARSAHCPPPLGVTGPCGGEGDGPALEDAPTAAPGGPQGNTMRGSRSGGGPNPAARSVVGGRVPPLRPTQRGVFPLRWLQGSVKVSALLDIMHSLLAFNRRAPPVP